MPARQRSVGASDGAGRGQQERDTTTRGATQISGYSFLPFWASTEAASAIKNKQVKKLVCARMVAVTLVFFQAFVPTHAHLGQLSLRKRSSTFLTEVSVCFVSCCMCEAMESTVSP